jgi:hypothetical protein
MNLTIASKIGMNRIKPLQAGYRRFWIVQPCHFLALGVAWAGRSGNPPKGTLILHDHPTPRSVRHRERPDVAMVTSNIYNGFVHLGQDSNPRPDLASPGTFPR